MQQGLPHILMICGSPWRIMSRVGYALEAVGKTETEYFTELDLGTALVASCVDRLDIVVVDEVRGQRRGEELIDLEGDHHIPVHVDVTEVLVVRREERELRDEVDVLSELALVVSYCKSTDFCERLLTGLNPEGTSCREAVVKDEGHLPRDGREQEGEVFVGLVVSTDSECQIARGEEGRDVLILVPWDIGVRVRVVPTSELREEVSEGRDAPVLGDVATDLGAEVQLIDALEPLIGGREGLTEVGDQGIVPAPVSLLIVGRSIEVEVPSYGVLTTSSPVGE